MKNMKFAIRDDDISYFTKPENLKRTYRGIWDVAPVSFAVIPFIHGSVRFIPKKYQKDKIYPIDKNKTLVNFLKKKVIEGKASIILHGYSHRRSERGHEFQTDSNLYEKVREGKEYLEGIFDTKITCFVAPNHTYSKQGMKAVIDNKLNIVGSPSLRNRPFFWQWGHVKNITKLSLFRLCKGPGIRYPYQLDFKTHREIYCYGIITSSKIFELKKGLEFSKKKNGVFCVALHSNTMSNRELSLLENLVKESQKIGAEYVTVDSVL